MPAPPSVEDILDQVEGSFRRLSYSQRRRRALDVSERQFAAWQESFVRGGRQALRRVLRGEAPAPRREERPLFEQIRLGLEQRARDLERRPNVVGTAIGRKVKEGKRHPQPCLTVFVSEKPPKSDLERWHRIPHRIQVKLGDRRKVWVPVDVVRSGPFRLQTGVAAAAVPAPAVYPGASISHTGYVHSNSGTFGCVVRSLSGSSAGQECLLTCFHVVQPPGNSFADFDVDRGSSAQEIVVHPSREDAETGPVSDLAVLQRGRRDRFIDAAIATFRDPQAVEPEIGGVAFPIGTRDLADFEIDQTMVHFFGRSTEHQDAWGVVRNLEASVDTDGFRMSGLIMTDRISLPGDSGALVLDAEWRALGLLVGATDRYSCVMPMAAVLAGMGAQLVTM